MRKMIVMAAAVAISSSIYAGCGSGCFNSCDNQGNACNRPGSCGVQGVPPDVRDYRANPNRGMYSTDEGANVPVMPSQYNRQGPWQSNNPQARYENYDRQLFSELQNDLRGTNLSITVRGGVVTLQGRVRSEEEKKAIYDRVNSNPRVKRVNNLLEVWNDTTTPWTQKK